MAKGKLAKKVKRGLKKLGKSSLLKSSVTLYIMLLVAISLVLLYLSKKDYNSLIVLIATGYLTNYFNKNMTITLGVAILASLLVRIKIYKREGFKEGADNNIANTSDTATSGGATEATDSAQVATSTAGGDSTNDQNQAAMPAAVKCWKKGAGDGEWLALDGAKNEKDCIGEGEKKIPGRCWNSESSNCKQGFSKRLIPSSEPAKIKSEDDEVDTDRIDYAKTLEQAYDNLQGMLGADGIKGLTSETTKLVQQQQGLMESLKGMGPMMKEAKSMMAGMKDMGSLESMKDMKAIVNSMAAKK